MNIYKSKNDTSRKFWYSLVSLLTIIPYTENRLYYFNYFCAKKLVSPLKDSPDDLIILLFLAQQCINMKYTHVEFLNLIYPKIPVNINWHEQCKDALIL